MTELENLLGKQKELSQLVGFKIELVDEHGIITTMGIMVLMAVANDLATQMITMAHNIIKRSQKGN